MMCRFGLRLVAVVSLIVSVRNNLTDLPESTVVPSSLDSIRPSPTTSQPTSLSDDAATSSEVTAASGALNREESGMVLVSPADVNYEDKTHISSNGTVMTENGSTTLVENRAAVRWESSPAQFDSQPASSDSTLPSDTASPLDDTPVQENGRLFAVIIPDPFITTTAGWDTDTQRNSDTILASNNLVVGSNTEMSGVYPSVSAANTLPAVADTDTAESSLPTPEDSTLTLETSMSIENPTAMVDNKITSEEMTPMLSVTPDSRLGDGKMTSAKNSLMTSTSSLMTSTSDNYNKNAFSSTGLPAKDGNNYSHTTNTGPQPGGSTEPSPFCNCRCQFRGRTLDNSTALEEKVKAIELDLTLNVTWLSSWRRRRESAPDHRMSAQGIGGLGVVFVVMVFSLIVLSDAQHWKYFILRFGLDSRGRKTRQA
ncbi:hypothetical protein V1264_010024 [Littorina saxatilis]|uniref:Uncharacterized protein n=1 Tax=Littorina saxatilis TaxID=31220 RepID=A0AAN9AND3_9CAEN